MLCNKSLHKCQYFCFILIIAPHERKQTVAFLELMEMSWDEVLLKQYSMTMFAVFGFGFGFRCLMFDGLYGAPTRCIDRVGKKDTFGSRQIMRVI